MEKIDVFLKNIAQVVLINSKWTGLFILIGLFVADWELGLAAVLGSALSVLLAPYFNYSAEEIHNGLAGYNSVLTAIGLALFLQSTTIAWIVLVISVILTLPVG
ncbi:MAG: urea transporter, partial [Staphylococcus lugdunensis]|nr:urea transporter [Staphylococcus lugdunensis]